MLSFGSESHSTGLYHIIYILKSKWTDRIQNYSIQLTPEAKTVLHCAEGYVTIVTSADPCLEGTREVSKSTRISGDGQCNLPKVSRDGHNITDA